MIGGGDIVDGGDGNVVGGNPSKNDLHDLQESCQVSCKILAR